MIRYDSISYQVALGGTLASFCLLALFLTGVLPMLYLVMAMLCSLLVTVMAAATTPYWAFIMYLAVSTLALFITPNKDAALIFILFFGHYPLLRPLFQKIKFLPLRGLLKLLTFNASMGAYFGLVILITGMDKFLESTGDLGKYGLLILFGMLNFTFIFYDISILIGVDFYEERIKPKLHLQNISFKREKSA